MRYSLAVYNPLRYRGYVYDRETGLYYLQSRYYNPEIGRFINADSLVSTGQGLLGSNMFLYCGNNPVCRRDDGGELWFVSLFIRTAIKTVTTIRQVYDIATSPRIENSYIADQSAYGIGDRALGITTVGHGGCGVIATYNALITLGDNKSFSNVLAYFNSNSGKRLVMNGLAGILPETVKEYFENHGYTVIMSNNRDGIDIYAKTADACILWYTFPSNTIFGAHFVEFHKTSSGYVAYNTSSSGISYFQRPSDYGYDGNRNYAIGIFIYR